MRRIAVWLLLLVGGESGESKAFTVTSPVEGQVVRSGEEITVAMNVGADDGAVGRVRYYWYRLGDEPLVTQLASAALVSTDQDIPPFGGLLPVPSTAIGAMRLLVVGEVVRGRLAGREEFDEIIVYAEPHAGLSRIEFETEKPLRLDTLWKIVELPVVGAFADGVSRMIQGVATGSAYRSSNENVVTVSSEGTLRVMGNGTATVLVTNRGQQGVLDVVVKANHEEENRPPTADAGPAQTVKGDSKVILKGLRSTDPDGDPLRYEWKQVKGNKVALLDAGEATPSFIAPKVSARRLFRFALRVTDLIGPDTVKGADSVPVFTDVWVEP